MIENDNFECRKEGENNDIICEREDYGKVKMPGGRSRGITVKGQEQKFYLDSIGGSRLTGGTANGENVTEDYKITRQFDDRINLKQKKKKEKGEL